MPKKKETSNLVILESSVCVQGKTIKVDKTIASQIVWFANHFKVKVSSGYRTKAENDAAGGAPLSDHLCGAAVDYVGSWLLIRVAHLYAVAQLKRGKLAFVELTWTKTNKHLHCSYFRCSH